MSETGYLFLSVTEILCFCAVVVWCAIEIHGAHKEIYNVKNKVENLGNIIAEESAARLTDSIFFYKKISSMAKTIQAICTMLNIEESPEDEVGELKKKLAEINTKKPWQAVVTEN